MRKVRAGTPADTVAVFATDDVASKDSERRGRLAKAIQSGKCLVAVEDEAVVGYLVIDRSFFGNAFIPLMSVSPEYRGKGIGTLLLRSAEQRCTSPKLFTSTNESNAVMRRLLEKSGFCMSGRVENLDEGDPEVIYFKRLSSGT